MIGYIQKKILKYYSIMNNEAIELNTVWIDKEIKMLNENDKLIKEYMKSIQIIHVFINSLSEIVKTYKTVHTFKDNNSILSFSDVHSFYKKNKIQNHVKYNMDQLIIYNVDFDDKLYSNIKSLSTINFLKSTSYLKDIVVQPSLFIFHEINCIYIMYKESNKNAHNKTLKIKKYKNNK